MNEGRACPEVRRAGVLGKAPQAVEVGIGWVAVEKLDRRIDQQAPMRKFHIIQPVVVYQKNLSFSPRSM